MYEITIGTEEKLTLPGGWGEGPRRRGAISIGKKKFSMQTRRAVQEGYSIWYNTVHVGTDVRRNTSLPLSRGQAKPTVQSPLPAKPQKSMKWGWDGREGERWEEWREKRKRR